MAGYAEYTPRLRELIADEAKETLNQVGKIRIIDFLAGACMVFVGIGIGGLPVGTLAAVALVLIALNRKSDFSSPLVGLFTLLMLLLVAYTAITSITLGISTEGQVIRRAFRIVTVIFLVLVLADRRVDFRSVILGAAASLMINVPAFYLGLAQDNYGGYLTGWLNDKNQSGLWYAAIGLLVVVSLNKKWHKIIAILGFSSLIFLTGSRTSFAAFAFSLLWLVIAPRLNIISKLGFALAIIWAVDYVTINFSQNSAFGDRTGTDALRERIDEASLEKLHSTPWHGLGYGQATVELGENYTFFFHNSVWTLIVEGGYPYMLMVIALTVIAALFWKQPGEKQGNKRNVAGEAALVLIFICSWRLGEVLFTVPWALSMGLVLTQLVQPNHHSTYTPTERI